MPKPNRRRKRTIARIRHDEYISNLRKLRYNMEYFVKRNKERGYGD